MRREEILAEAGVSNPEFNTDPLAWLKERGLIDKSAGQVEGTPPVEIDRQKLRLYYRGVLAEDETELYAFLLAGYQDWSVAGEAIQAELRAEEKED